MLLWLICDYMNDIEESDSSVVRLAKVQNPKSQLQEEGEWMRKGKSDTMRHFTFSTLCSTISITITFTQHAHYQELTY